MAAAAVVPPAEKEAVADAGSLWWCGEGGCERSAALGTWEVNPLQSSST